MSVVFKPVGYVRICQSTERNNEYRNDVGKRSWRDLLQLMAEVQRGVGTKDEIIREVDCSSKVLDKTISRSTPVISNGSRGVILLNVYAHKSIIRRIHQPFLVFPERRRELSDIPDDGW